MASVGQTISSYLSSAYQFITSERVEWDPYGTIFRLALLSYMPEGTCLGRQNSFDKGYFKDKVFRQIHPLSIEDLTKIHAVVCRCLYWYPVEKNIPIYKLAQDGLKNLKNAYAHLPASSQTIDKTIKAIEDTIKPTVDYTPHKGHIPPILCYRRKYDLWKEKFQVVLSALDLRKEEEKKEQEEGVKVINLESFLYAQYEKLKVIEVSEIQHMQEFALDGSDVALALNEDDEKIDDREGSPVDRFLTKKITIGDELP